MKPPDPAAADPVQLAPSARQTFLTMAGQELLRQCRAEVCRGTGPGGQKRNRTESAIRLVHLATGVSVACDETRSQHLNRQIALRKLRHAIALRCRCQPAPPYAGPWAPGAKSADYPGWLAAVLDHLEERAFRLSETAVVLGVSTGRLSRDLAADPALWQAVNQGRRRYGHKPLTPDR